MDKITSLLQRFIEPIAVKFSRNKYLQATADGIMETVTITIVGSIFMLLCSFPIQSYIDWLASTGIDKILSIPGKVTIDLISLYAVFFVARSFAKQNQVASTPAGVIALVSFLMLTPINNVEGISQLPFTYLGGAGMFSSILVGLIASKLYCVICKRGWTIRLPEGVPPAVATSFSSLIPSGIVALSFLLLAGVISFTDYGSIHNMIYTVLQQRMMVFAGASIGACVVAMLITNIFWFFGLHGSSIIGAVVGPIYWALQLQNLEAWNAGLTPPNIICSSFTSLAAVHIIGLCIASLLFAKSKRFKAMGKLTTPPMLFNICEPALFGMPIVLNPFFLLPFLFIGPLIALLNYAVMSAGIVPAPNGAIIPWMTPPVIFGLLQGSWKIAALQFVDIIISTLIWIPFFKIADKQAVKAELAFEDTEE